MTELKTQTIELKVRHAGVPVPIAAIVVVDPRSEPGKVRLSANAMGMHQTPMLEHADATRLAAALWSAAEAAELAGAGQG